MRDQAHLLKTRRFLPLFVTQFSGAFNDNVFKNALIILITYIAATDLGIDADILVTAAGGLFILPFFLFSTFAGQLADKYEKSRLIRQIKQAEILLMCIAAVGFYLGNAYLLLTVLFLMGTQSSFFGPLKYSILPDHLEEDELIAGNALVEMATFLAILTGTILGGILILKTGGKTIVSFMIVLLACFGWMASRYIPKAGPAAPKLKIKWNLLAEGWRMINQTREDKSVFLSILGISWFWLIGFVFLTQFPIYGKEIIGGNEDVVTLFLTLFSAGIGIGSMLCNSILKGQVSAEYVPVGVLGMALSIFILVFMTPVSDMPGEGGYIDFFTFITDTSAWPVCISLFMISVFGGIFIVPLYAIMQSRCAEDHRSRTVAANNILNAFMMVFGALMTMFLLSAGLNVLHLFLILAGANLVIGLVVYMKTKV